jgi:hypothetical protein
MKKLATLRLHRISAYAIVQAMDSETGREAGRGEAQ